VLSKADLLAAEDRERALQYVAGHIRSDLGLDLPVHAVSIRSGHTSLLERWLASEILPLYGRHAELARQSLNRKIGALRLGVEAALQAHLGRQGAVTIDGGKARDLEAELRTASGAIAQARSQCLDITDRLRGCADALIRAAADRVIEAKGTDGGATRGDLVKIHLEQAVAEPAAQIASTIQEAARGAGSVLAKAAAALGLDSGPDEEELLDVLKNMPRFDPGNLEIHAGRGGAASLLGRRCAAARVARRIRSRAGSQIADALAIYARVLQAWVRKTFAELQERYDSDAGAFRAHLDRLAASPAGVADQQALRSDLAELAAAAQPRSQPAPVPPT
jgi:hypothetical protein